MRPSIVTILLPLTVALLNTEAKAQPRTRELRVFVYPQSGNNTYRLPQYPLSKSTVLGLTKCGTKKAEGVRFESDGRTFHLDNPLEGDAPIEFKTRISVQRGSKGKCFRATIRVVVPLLSEPDPATWSVEWSPARPKAVDIVVPSTALGTNAAMQAAHRLIFPWSGLSLAGSWADCSGSGCRWRIPADGAVRREFLTRSTVPVRVESIPLSGLSAQSAVFQPLDGTARTYSELVELSKWKIKPELFRRVQVSVGQTEVPLAFPGAWALQPTTDDKTGASVVHTASGPVLRFSDPNTVPPLALTPGGGQMKALIQLDVASPQRAFLNYVAKFGSTTVKLPQDIRVCLRTPSNRMNVGTVTVPGAAVSALPKQFVRAGASCAKPTGRLFVTLFSPVLHASDVKAALEVPAPNTLDIFVRSRALVQSTAIRDDTELVVGDHPPGKWTGCTAVYCTYRIENLAGAQDLVRPTITFRSKRMQAEATPLLDAETGRPFEPQQIQVGTWRVAEPEMVVGVPFFTGDHRASGSIGSPAARFLKPGPVTCSVGSCFIDPNQGAMAVSVQSTAPLTASTVPIRDVPLVDGVDLALVRGEVWREARPRLRLKLSTCSYKVRQLTRAIAGLNDALVLYRAQLRPGSSQSCPGLDWSAVASTGERGRAELANGLLSVYLESIPVPKEGGAGEVDIRFAYPSGQKVRIDGPSKLGIEPAPPVGPPRVSVRLPGGDLRPLAATFAVNRPNVMYFDMIDDPLEWGVELVRARSLFRPCRTNFDIVAPGSEARVPDFSDDDSAGSYCIIPNEPTADSLKIRFVRQGPTELLLRRGVDPNDLPQEERERFRRAGWLEVETGRQAKPWYIAMDLVAATEMRCGDRVIATSAGVTPRAVDFDAFDNCEVRVRLGAPARPSTDSTPLEETIAFYGDQKIIVRARLTDSDDNSGAKVLNTVRLRAENDDQDVLVIPVSLAEVGAKPPEDYAVVEVEVAHDPAFYSSDDKWSAPSSVARLRVRRGPEYLAWWGSGGRGARLFGAFTAVPFSLFRYPHSGKGVTTSQAVDELEKANVALGVVGILEAWNFDHNESIIPVINPQLQIGALVSSNPTTGDLSLPGISLIAGIGLRTGVGTSPGKGVETSLKSVVWYEMLFQEAGRGNNPSHNILFGFTVDLGSTPN